MGSREGEAVDMRVGRGEEREERREEKREEMMKEGGRGEEGSVRGSEGRGIVPLARIGRRSLEGRVEETGAAR